MEDPTSSRQDELAAPPSIRVEGLTVHTWERLLRQGEGPVRWLCTLLLLLASSPALAQLQACPAGGDCVTVSITAPASPVARGDSFPVSVLFQPGNADAVLGGIDDISALTFSLGIPGLELADCTNPTADGLTSAVQAEVAPPLRLIVENTSCDDQPLRPCLCPGIGQTRASYVNLAIFGPKAQPGQDPDQVMTLPSGELLTLTLRARPESAADITLHVFNATDAPGTKPAYGAQASIGDDAGVDLSSAVGVSRIRTQDGQVAIGEASTPTRTPSLTATLPASATPTQEHTATATHTAATATVTQTAATATATQTAATATVTPPPTVVPSATSTAVPPTASATVTRTATSPAPTGTVTPPPETSPTPTSMIEPPFCLGDCSHDGIVTLEERVTGVRIALGELQLFTCDAFAGPTVTVDKLVASVAAALDVCAP